MTYTRYGKGDPFIIIWVDPLLQNTYMTHTWNIYYIVQRTICNMCVYISRHHHDDDEISCVMALRCEWWVWGVIYWQVWYIAGADVWNIILRRHFSATFSATHMFTTYCYTALLFSPSYKRKKKHPHASPLGLGGYPHQNSPLYITKPNTYTDDFI